MLRLRDSLPCTTLYSRCHKLSNFNLSALQRETIRSRPELVKVTPGAPAAPKETGAPWKIDLGRGLSVHFVVRLRKSVLARRICDGHFGRLCGWLSINLFSTRPPSLSGSLSLSLSRLFLLSFRFVVHFSASGEIELFSAVRHSITRRRRRGETEGKKAKAA